MIYMRSFKGRSQIYKCCLPVNLKDFCTYEFEYNSPKNNNILFVATEDFRVRKLAEFAQQFK